MKRLRILAAFIKMALVVCAGASIASDHINNSYPLQMRTGNHEGFRRIVLEADTGLLSKGKVSLNGGDIVVDFAGMSFRIEQDLTVSHKRVDGTLLFPLEGSASLKTFLLENPGRLVIDVYPDGKDTDKKTGPDKMPEKKAQEKAEVKKHKTEKKETPPAQKNRGSVTAPHGSDKIEDYIPEEYKKLWAQLQSGNPYGVLKDIASQKPGDLEILPAYHYIYAEAYKKLQRYMSAIEQYRLAYIYASDGLLKEQALLSRAELYLQSGFHYEARADYLVFIRNFPSSGFIEQAHLGLGKSLSKIRLYDEAIEHFKKAGEGPDALYSMANALQRIEKTEDAKAVYEKAALQDKSYPLTSPETFYLIGENMRMRGELTDAKQQLASIELGPYKDDASIGLGLIAMEESDIDSAIRRFEMAAQSRDELLRAKALFNLSLTYMAGNKYDKAVTHLEEIRHNHIDSSLYKDTLLLLSRLYRKDGKTRESISMLKELVYGSHPPEESLTELEGIILEASGKSAQEDKGEIGFADLWDEVGHWLVDEKREKFLLKIVGGLRHEGKPFLSLCTWLVENASTKGRAAAAVDLADYYAGIGDMDAVRKYVNIANAANAVNVAEAFKKTKDRILRVEARIHRADGDHKTAVEKITQIRDLQEGDIGLLGDILFDMDQADREDLNRALTFYERKIGEAEWSAESYVKLADFLYIYGDKSEALKYYQIAYQKNPGDAWTAYRVGRGEGAPASKELYSRLGKEDTLYGRLARTRLMEMDILNRVEEVY